MALHASFSSYSSYSSSSFEYGWTFDVFLSFRGTDTRHGFTGNLCKALYARGIRTFFDDKELQSGKEIRPSLVKAIQESRIAIIVFSKNYAYSCFCLDELATIMECVKGKGRLVLPIFYDVNPSDLRHHKGTYGEALARHEKRFKDDKKKVQKWREALHQAANLSGKHFKFGNEYEYSFIEKITREISKKISYVPLYVADYAVGLESRVWHINTLLNDGYDDRVHMVGIYGIGGIGKTTLARAVCNMIFDQFEGLCFLENVRENSNNHGLEYLQEMLLSEIVGEKDIKLGSVNKGIQIIKHRLCQKKVLLILDDVDKRQHLQALAGWPDWFGSGSRVMITTRDKHLLACHGVERTYELNGLNEEDACKLFKWNAFKNKEVDPSFVHIINRVVTYATHIPLALEVIGSNLYGKEIEEWKSVLDRYKRIPEKDIQERLKISYDALEEDVRSLFLDIACCFKGFNLTEVKDILCAHHDVCLEHAIGVLVDKSLIKINPNGKVTLHDLIQDMGREIVRQEGNPSKRSRLWFSKDIIQVLEDNEGTCKTELILLDLLGSKVKVVEWDGGAFKNMKSLKTLIIRNAYFSQGPKHLPNSLRVLEWWRYPSHSLPDDFCLKKLVIFKLSYSCLTSVNFLRMQKELVNMRVLNFNGAEFITDIPNLSCVPNLEELSFQLCKNLIKIDESVGFLGKLKILDAYGCIKLKSFPPLMLTSLAKLNLSYCSSLENFPEILGKMENIRWLFLVRTSIKEVPSSIRNLTQLHNIQMHKCGLVEFPIGIILLPELRQVYIDGSHNQNEGQQKVSSTLRSGNKSLSVSNCNISDEIFPIVFAWVAINVVELYLFGLNCTVLPACITECIRLRKLNLTHCNFREIRVIPPNLESLTATSCRSLQYLDLTVLPVGTKDNCFLTSLILDYCESLQEIRGIPTSIEYLSALGCTSLTDSCRSMLLNQELHEEGGNMQLYMPGSSIPEWFEHRNSGLTISFWFRNMLPAVSLCVVPGGLHDRCIGYQPGLTINGNTVNEQWLKTERIGRPYPMAVVDHIFFHNEKPMKVGDNVKLLKNKKWNHAKILFDPNLSWGPTRIGMQIGIHVFKEESNMEDIRFTDPYEKDNNNDVNSDSEFEFNAIKRTSSTSNVKGLQEQQLLTSFDQRKLEDCENVNKAKGKGMATRACNSNGGEDNGKNPLTKLLSATKESTKKYQPTSNSKIVARDQLELDYQVTNLEGQLVSNDESTMNANGCHVMGSNQRTAKWQLCLCSLFSSLVSLCSSSSSLDST